MRKPKRAILKNNVISALQVRNNLGRLLRRVETDQESLVIEKRGRPRAVLLSIRDYVRLAAREPEVLRLIAEEAKRKGVSTSARAIETEIRAVRAAKTKR
jgi:prevent-host-death family protein